MKLSELLKIPTTEDPAIEGVLYTTGLIDMDVMFFCNAFGIDNELSNEEKRDYIVGILKKADALGNSFDPDVFQMLCTLANNYEPVEDDDFEYAGSTR